jgi:hypothetical protein
VSQFSREDNPAYDLRDATRHRVSKEWKRMTPAQKRNKMRGLRAYLKDPDRACTRIVNGILAGMWSYAYKTRKERTAFHSAGGLARAAQKRKEKKKR